MQMCDVELAARRMRHQLVMLLQDFMEALQVDTVLRLLRDLTIAQDVTARVHKKSCLELDTRHACVPDAGSNSCTARLGVF